MNLKKARLKNLFQKQIYCIKKTITATEKMIDNLCSMCPHFRSHILRITDDDLEMMSISLTREKHSLQAYEEQLKILDIEEDILQ